MVDFLAIPSTINSCQMQQFRRCPKNGGTPKLSISTIFSLMNHPHFWETPIYIHLWKPPYLYISCNQKPPQISWRWPPLGPALDLGILPGEYKLWNDTETCLKLTEDPEMWIHPKGHWVVMLFFGKFDSEWKQTHNVWHVRIPYNSYSCCCSIAVVDE